jgi:hypothetical protein
MPRYVSPLLLFYTSYTTSPCKVFLNSLMGASAALVLYFISLPAVIFSRCAVHSLLEWKSPNPQTLDPWPQSPNPGTLAPFFLGAPCTRCSSGRAPTPKPWNPGTRAPIPKPWNPGTIFSRCAVHSLLEWKSSPKPWNPGTVATTSRGGGFFSWPPKARTSSGGCVRVCVGA